MATFVIQPVLELLGSLQNRVLEIIEPVDADLSLKLDISMAFKDAQIQLLEQLKKVSSLEYCSSLKQSFSTRPLDSVQQSNLSLSQKGGSQFLAHKSELSSYSNQMNFNQLKSVSGTSQLLLQSARHDRKADF